MADGSYEFHPASPDEHGWWPLFRISGHDQDNEPLWDRATYERPGPQVQRAWKSMIEMHGDRNSEEDQPGRWMTAEGWAFAYEPLGGNYEECFGNWDWRAYIGRNEQQFEAMRELRRRYREMRQGAEPSTANARLFAVDFDNVGHAFSIHLPTDRRYMMQMVLDDREPLEEWLQYQAPIDSFTVPEWLLMIRRVTHIRVIDGRTERPVSTDAWTPVGQIPYYIATRGRYMDFVNGRRTIPGPRSSEELDFRHNRADALPVTWLLDDWFLNLAEYTNTNHLTLETRANFSFPTRVADRSARTDLYTLAQERGEAPRHRVSMAQAINAARVIHRCSKAVLHRAWGPKGWKKEESKRALKDVLGPSGDGDEPSSPASKRPAAASGAGPSGSGTAARVVLGRRGGGSLPSLVGLRL